MRYSLCIIIVFLLSVPFFIGVVPGFDDWLYASQFSGAAPQHGSWLDFPRWCASHWLTTNGRWGNYVLPFMALLPPLPRALLCAAFVAAMYALAVRCAGELKGWIPAALCTAICFFMPWWDYMAIYACQTNYVWASVTALAAYLLIFSRQGRISWWEWPVVLLAGCSHEAASLPLLGGMFMYFVINRNPLTRRQKRLGATFIAGVIIVVLCPALIQRAAAHHKPDDSPLLIFLKSDAIAGALYVSLAAALCFRRSRRTTLSLFTSSRSVFIWAAGASAAISLFSGIVGRTGWFAELYALIAFAWWCSLYCRRPRRGLAAALIIALAVQLGITAVWQLRMGEQHQRFIEEYAASPDGIVYIDNIIRDTDAPAIVLNKVKALPDPDDTGLLEALRRYFRTDSAAPLALPADARGHLDGGMPLYSLSNGDFLLTDLPPESTAHRPFDNMPPFFTFMHDGRKFVAVKASQTYYCTPLVLDPGDRLR